jgi:hypothetical protein
MAMGLWASAAGADGAFPDSFSLFAPADQSSRLLLATNFGVLVTQDGAANWWVICEQAMQAPNGFNYQVGPPPAHRIFGVSLAGLSVSPDEGCSWGRAAVGASGAFVLDVFPDPGDATHVLAVALPLAGDAGPLPQVIYESRNGGDAFPEPPIFLAPPSSAITGVEISRSQPGTYYASLVLSGGPPVPVLARSDDNGATWQLFDQSGAFGAARIGIAAVDPEDAQRVYLRVAPADGGAEGLGIVTDGGRAARLALTLSPGGRMTAFLRRADRSLLVAQGPIVPPGPPNGALASNNGGATWSSVMSNLHLRALAERGGALYLAADNYADGFAVGVSLDGGTPTPLLAYHQICGIAQAPEVEANCATWWAAEAAQLGDDAGCPDGGPLACTADGQDAGPASDAGGADASTPDAGAPGNPDSGTGGDAGTTGDAGGSGDAGQISRKGGCGCQSGTGALWALAAALGLAARRPTRGRRATRR